MNIIRKYKISKITGIPLEGLDAEIISFIKSITDDLIPFKHEEYSKSIFYMNSKGEWIFEQDKENTYFHVRYKDFWEVLETKYNMEYSDIQIFIKYMVEEAFKQKVVTPGKRWKVGDFLVEEAFKQKVVTPLRCLESEVKRWKKLSNKR